MARIESKAIFILSLHSSLKELIISCNLKNIQKADIEGFIYHYIYHV